MQTSFICSAACAEKDGKRTGVNLCKVQQLKMLRAQELSPRISLYTPGHPNPGQLVIICSWADAKRKQISKYIQLHNVAEPDASILLIRTSITTLFEPYAWQRSALQPAAQYIIESTGKTLTSSLEQSRSQWGQSVSKGRIVLHSFSNGGSLTATQLLILFRLITKAPLSLQGIIMDSTPDGGTYERSHCAIATTKSSSRLQRASLSIVAHAALIPIWVSYAIGGLENSQHEMRRIFLDRDHIDTLYICYVYSKSDKVTNWSDVVTHAEEARAKGWYVEKHEFKGSSHCAHIQSNPELYATIVRQVWGVVKPQARL